MRMIEHHGLKVAPALARFVETEALPGTGLDQETFWSGFAALVHKLAPRNRALLAERDRLQAALDQWHRAHPGPVKDMAAYRSYLESIGYIVPVPAKVQASTEDVDAEIAEQAGPQLVVPLSNARYTLNAANARWGSLYDALYGTDAIPETDGAERGTGFNPKRGALVIAFARKVLDDAAPLAAGSHAGATRYAVEGGALVVMQGDRATGLREPAQFVGYRGTAASPTAILLKHNGLHLEIQIDPHDPIGRIDTAGIKDVVLEAALTTIVDCEDSVAAVDADDKVQVYRNWLGLMNGSLSENVTKGGKTFARHLNADREYTGPDGRAVVLHGRSLLFIRNVGHLMTNPAVVDREGNDIPEGILDAVMTTLCSLHDRQRRMNSRRGAIYIVKPKMHGPLEAAFANQLLARVEDLLQLPRNTIKMGIMDEERRTSVNLAACINEVAARVAFINTGFLDRTGDGSRPGHAQGRHEVQPLDHRLRTQQRPGRPRGRIAWPRADRQGHVGHARHDARDARAKDRASEIGRQHCMGALAHGGDPARAALPPGGCAGGAARAGKDRCGGSAHGTARGAADHSRGRAGAMERR